MYSYRITLTRNNNRGAFRKDQAIFSKFVQLLRQFGRKFVLIVPETATLCIKHNIECYKVDCAIVAIKKVGHFFAHPRFSRTLNNSIDLSCLFAVRRNNEGLLVAML